MNGAHDPSSAPPPAFNLPEPLASIVAERPEALVGGAFLAGLLLAAILKSLGRH